VHDYVLEKLQVDTRGVLTGSPFGWKLELEETHAYEQFTDVRDEVRQRIEDFAPGGGFVFNPVHNIQADVGPENIMVMWEALMEYGRY